MVKVDLGIFLERTIHDVKLILSIVYFAIPYFENLFPLYKIFCFLSRLSLS